MNNQYRIMSVEPTPAIKDAIRESGCPMPETMWAAIIARHDLVSGQQAPIQSGELADGIEGDPTLDNILDRMLKYSGQEYGDGEVRKCYGELCEFIDNRAAPAAQQQASAAQERTCAGKERDDAGPEDFGVPTEFAERARLYASWFASAPELPLKPLNVAGPLGDYEYAVLAYEHMSALWLAARRRVRELEAAQAHAHSERSEETLTDAECVLALNLANVETDAWFDGLEADPTSTEVDGFLVRALLTHLARKG